MRNRPYASPPAGRSSVPPSLPPVTRQPQAAQVPRQITPPPRRTITDSLTTKLCGRAGAGKRRSSRYVTAGNGGRMRTRIPVIKTHYCLTRFPPFHHLRLHRRLHSTNASATHRARKGSANFFTVCLHPPTMPLWRHPVECQ